MIEKVWEKDDFFHHIGNKRLDMDPAIVEIGEEPVPVTWGYNFDIPPKGRMLNLRLEDGEIVGELEFFDEKDTATWETLKRDVRLGGYYIGVELDEAKENVIKCRLKAVSIMLKSQTPGWPKAVTE